MDKGEEGCPGPTKGRETGDASPARICRCSRPTDFGILRTFVCKTAAETDYQLSSAM